MAAIPRVREGSVELYTEPTVSVVCELSVGVGWMPTPHNYVVQGGVVTDLAQNTRVAPSVAPYPYGWYGGPYGRPFGWGFGFFGFCLMPLLFLGALFMLSRLFFLPDRTQVDRAYEIRVAARETIAELAQVNS